MTTTLEVLGVVLWAFAEWSLPRMHGIKANSTIEAVANVLLPFLQRVPLVGMVTKKLSTPEVKPKVEPEKAG